MASYWKKLILTLAMSLTAPALAQTNNPPQTPEQFLSTPAKQAALQYIKQTSSDYANLQADQNIGDWLYLFTDPKNKNAPELDVVKRVNDFFNQEDGIAYASDPAMWGDDEDGRDYWSTPKEFTSYGAGDCEDYAFAKYFTLIGLGIPNEQLHMAHAIYHGMSSNGANANGIHMVLLFTPHNELSNTLHNDYVLDNINHQLLRQQDRTDLTITQQDDGTKLMLTRLAITDPQHFDMATLTPTQLLDKLQNQMPMHPHPEPLAVPLTY